MLLVGNMGKQNWGSSLWTIPHETGLLVGGRWMIWYWFAFIMMLIWAMIITITGDAYIM